MQFISNELKIRVFSVSSDSSLELLSAHNALRPYLSESENYYPGFKAWYQKVYFQLLRGGRSIITAYSKNNIAGFAILKNSIYENKICTFKINKQYRKNGIAANLMTTALNILGFKNLLITMPDYLHEDFKPLMNKFGFCKICKKHNAYTRNHSEFFYALNSQLIIYLYKNLIAAEGKMWAEEARGHFEPDNVPPSQVKAALACLLRLGLNRRRRKGQRHHNVEWNLEEIAKMSQQVSSPSSAGQILAAGRAAEFLERFVCGFR